VVRFGVGVNEMFQKLARVSDRGQEKNAGHDAQRV
jgi:hypothetical protein